MVDIDKLIPSKSDRPALYSKWLTDLNKKWDRPEYPSGLLGKCQFFSDDYYQCADGLSWNRAKVECRFELEDWLECTSGNKLKERQAIILKQRKKLIKEGKYTPPPFPQSLPSFGDSAI